MDKIISLGKRYIFHWHNLKKEFEQVILFNKDNKGTAPQAPRYTSFDRLIKSKKLSEIF